MSAAAPRSSEPRSGASAAGFHALAADGRRPVTAAHAQHDAVPARWLVFHLCGQRYALPVGELREALAWQQPTPVPCAPAGVLGLIHRRGTILPVADIRRPLGLDDAGPAPHGALVLIDDAMALAVDAIGDIFLPTGERQPAPEGGTNSALVQAFVTHGADTVVLLDARALVAAAGTGGTPLARSTTSME